MNSENQLEEQKPQVQANEEVPEEAKQSMACGICYDDSNPTRLIHEGCSASFCTSCISIIQPSIANQIHTKSN